MLVSAEMLVSSICPDGLHITKVILFAIYVVFQFVTLSVPVDIEN